MKTLSVPNARLLGSTLLVAVLLATSVACSRADLRGEALPSPDGKTYLVVDDANGGACGPILVDGRPWPFAIHAPGAITPGRHRIECGFIIEFEIGAGTTFHFNYWGP